jgi:hypothetical protein
MELLPRYQNDPGYSKKIFRVVEPSVGGDFGTVLAAGARDVRLQQPMPLAVFQRKPLVPCGQFIISSAALALLP